MRYKKISAIFVAGILFALPLNASPESAKLAAERSQRNASPCPTLNSPTKKGHGHKKPPPLTASDLSIGGYTLVKSEPVNGGLVDCTYTAALTRSGNAPVNEPHVIARLKSGPLRTVIIDGRVSFGIVAAGATVTSSDTFTIRRDPRVKLKAPTLAWEIVEAPELIVPSSWGGEWEITMTHRDPTTNQITSVDKITDVIQTDELFGVGLFADLANCEGTVSDLHFETVCSGKRTVAGCNVSATLEVTGERQGDTLAGSGQSMIAMSGVCGNRSDGNFVEFIGVRLGVDQGGGQPGSSLVKKFVRHPLVDILLPE